MLVLGGVADCSHYTLSLPKQIPLFIISIVSLSTLFFLLFVIHIIHKKIHKLSRNMYNWEKSLREDKMRTNPKNPSFSSTLLDEIYREIDGGEELKQPKDFFLKKHGSSSNGGGRAKARSSIEDEEMASFRRACLFEKWMEKKVNEKVSAQRGSLFPEFDQKDNDPLFFSSSSSDSSFGGFSSSETESFGAGKARTSCFTAPRPKPVRTSVLSEKLEHSAEQGEFYLFDDYRINNHQTNKTEDLIKSKTRALKIYDNLKKVKQPISPGGRLTSFINSLFNPKKNKDLHPTGNGGDRKTQTSSTCSSSSSFSRFYLSKNSPNSKEKPNKRTEESRRCGHKSIYDEDFERFGMPNGDKPISPLMDRKNQENNEFSARNIRDEEDYDDEDDAASDSSSDLFELDHLALFKNDKFCNDLPVYETTNLGMNRAIASGLIR